MRRVRQLGEVLTCAAADLSKQAEQLSSEVNSFVEGVEGGVMDAPAVVGRWCGIKPERRS